MRGGIIKTMRRAAIERGQDRGISDHVLDSGTTTADPSFFSDRAARPCGRFGLLARWMS